jgi:RNA polymerase sigma factor (sigma-70 family)
MGDKVGLEPARPFPGELRRLIEATDSPEQERAWSEFLSSYSRLFLYVARQLARDHDVVMDRYAFVVERLREQNYRRLRAFAADGRGKFTTWLIVVVRRLCLDHDRQKHGRAPPPGLRKLTVPHRLVELAYDPEILDQLPDRSPPADEALDQKQILEQLAAAIATLSPSDQLLIALRYQDDRSAREIASLMSLPTPFHAYRRLNQVHRSLRQALASRRERPPRMGSAESDRTAVQYDVGATDPLKPTP